jgi:hypothetical protein
MGSWRRLDPVFMSAAAVSAPHYEGRLRSAISLSDAGMLAELRQINFDWHCSLPSDDVAKVRCCLARSVDAPASSMPRSRSPTGFPVRDWPLTAEPTEAQDRDVMERKIAEFRRKRRREYANSPLLNVPIRQVMGGAHYLPQPALPEVPGHGLTPMAGGTRSGAVARPVLSRRVHAAEQADCVTSPTRTSA